MECGFWHPQRGYWQTITPPDAQTRARYPIGTVEVPLRPSPDHDWSGNEWTPKPSD